jgi:hypothetical protein
MAVKGVVTQRFSDKEEIQGRKTCWKSHAQCFWDRKGAIFVDFLELGHTLSAARHTETVKKLKSQIARVQSEKKIFFFSMTTPGPTPPS